MLSRSNQRKLPGDFRTSRGAAYFTAITGLLVTEPSLVAAFTNAHPYAMGFAKFAILATFGECPKNHLTAGQWIPSALPLRALIWGLVGIWITAAFPFMDGGCGRWPRYISGLRRRPRSG